MFSSLSVSINGKHVTLHESNYNYMAYILIAFVKSTAFVCSASTKRSHFHHYDDNLVLYVNGVQHPSKSFAMDCSSPYGAGLTKHYFQLRVFTTMAVLI